MQALQTVKIEPVVILKNWLIPKQLGEALLITSDPQICQRPSPEICAFKNIILLQML